MCGVAGFAGFGDRSDIVRMTRALAHRGPDGEGFLEDPDNAVFLGHRRLAIIDIAGGAQPLFNGDGRVAVIYNGEIYNHAELRAELQALGYKFKTDHSDTEVLVHGYDEWGEDLPLRLNGMFAFAIYDMTRRRLFLARDRFGEKPLYYMLQNGVFAFGSEITALVGHSRLHLAIEQIGIQKFLAHGFTPAPHTIYRDCRKLPAGHVLTYDLAANKLEIRRYWQFDLQPDESLGDSDEGRLSEELRHLFFQAVKRRMISDVPLGVFLSGGMDSTAVLAAAARSRPAGALDTFTIGFTEPSFDESAFARMAAATFGACHHETQFDLGSMRDLIAPVLERMDEPLGDPSILPTFLVSRFARTHATVVLTGDGGDELFAGYDPFKALLPARLYRALVPSPLHRGARRLADMLPISRRNMSLDFRLRRFLGGLSYTPPYWNPIWLAPVEPKDLADLLQQTVSITDLYAEVLESWEACGAASLVDRSLTFYTRFYLQDDILMKTDRAAMMNGLEARAAFLDNDLVAFCERLPARFKLRHGRSKYLLRRALRGVVPDQILDRPKKGFGIPISQWLREMQPAEAGPALGLTTETMARQWDEHRRGKCDHRLALWALTSLAHHCQGMQRRESDGPDHLR